MNSKANRHQIRCPSCNTVVHVRYVHEEVNDYFFHFKGAWGYSQCEICSTLIQNPSISDEQLSKSYATYYTHQPESKKSLIFDFLKRCRDGYLARKYDIHIDKSIALGYYTIRALPFAKSGIDAHDCRHIEKCHLVDNSLLDFGCGSGKFMSFASKLGWRTVGYDLDQGAIDTARKKGCHVIQGDVNALSVVNDNTFNYITLSHVIEHVRDPNLLLQECYRLLSDNGTLWIETPNCNSIGHTIFGKYWRGIEAPRHLFIFNDKSLTNMLTRCGFQDVKLLHRGGVVSDVFAQSLQVSKENKAATLTKMIMFTVITPLVELLGFAYKPKAEFVTLTARKVIK